MSGKKRVRKRRTIPELEQFCGGIDDAIKRGLALREFVIDESDIRMRDDGSFVITLVMIPNPLIVAMSGKKP